MEFQNIRGKINRLIEGNRKSCIERIRNGDDPEQLVNQLIEDVHSAWTNEATEYSTRIERERRNFEEELNGRINILQAELDAARNHNAFFKTQFQAHLRKLDLMHEDHKKFYQLKEGIQRLIDLCGRYSSILYSLLNDHENVTSAEDRDQKRFLEILRDQCAENARQENRKITNYLVNELSGHLPSPSCCKQVHLIKDKLTELQTLLSRMQSDIVMLCPDNWEDEDIELIRSGKKAVEEKSGELLQLIEEAKANHKSQIHQAIHFNPPSITN